MLFSHICVGTNNVEKAKKFYDAIFKVMNLSDSGFDKKGRPFYAKDGQKLIICKPINGQAATYSNGGTIGFQMNSPEQVNQFRTLQVYAKEQINIWLIFVILMETNFALFMKNRIVS